MVERRDGGRKPAPRGSQPRRDTSAPEIDVKPGAKLGRESLEAIRIEMRESQAQGRQRQHTLGYDEMNSPRARRPATSTPDIEITETRPGMDTLVAIEEELQREAHELDAAAAQSYGQAEVFELLTFVILHGAIPADATEEEKRGFVVHRLWHRLPPGGIEMVRRIELRPADDRALLMRVWCSVPRTVR